MLIKAFKRPGAGSPEVSILGDAVNDSLSQLATNPLLIGRLITDIPITTANKIIPHKLGKPFIGWIVTRNRTSIIIYEGPQTSPEMYLTLTGSGSGTIDIWVF